MQFKNVSYLSRQLKDMLLFELKKQNKYLIKSRYLKCRIHFFPNMKVYLVELMHNRIHTVDGSSVEGQQPEYNETKKI